MSAYELRELQETDPHVRTGVNKMEKIQHSSTTKRPPLQTVDTTTRSSWFLGGKTYITDLVQKDCFGVGSSDTVGWSHEK